MSNSLLHDIQMSKEKKNVVVSIGHLEKVYRGTDFSEFEVGETYPMPTVLDACRPRSHFERGDMK